jgi:hypothetical protein
MKLAKYSIGIGDRFGHEGQAQLRALDTALRRGTQITPVWNKSHREHTLTGSSPKDTRRRAEKAVRAGGWPGPYHVDADHIGMATVDDFLEPCDYFTIDVAAAIGQTPPAETTAAFLRHTLGYKGPMRVPGLGSPMEVTDELLGAVARKYLGAVEEAGRVYRHILDRRGTDPFIIELSLDEADAPQTPEEILFILAAAAQQGLPVQTIAPKFSGAFFKGIDFMGDVGEFAREFEANLAVLEFAKKTFGLPRDLKLSIHSGSDKFSLYPLMHRILLKREAGVHLKTSGTTWLEEVIGLAAAGGAGLRFARDLSTAAVARLDELIGPYAAVVSIEPSFLPSPDELASWGSQEFIEALQHDPSCPRFNAHFRQLIHTSFRLAAEMGDKFTDLLERYREPIETRVTDNLLRRHVGPLFLGGPTAAGASVA